jgi:hypothetical protein
MDLGQVIKRGSVNIMIWAILSQHFSYFPIILIYLFLKSLKR